VRPIVVALIALVATLPVRAGIYSPNEPFVFEIGADGFATPIQFSGGFDSILAGYREEAIRPANPAGPPNRRRQEAMDRVKEREAKGIPALSSPELAGLTADLIRLNRNEEALNILQPLARDPRRGGFLAYAHLARAHAGRGEWREAYEQQQMAVRYVEFPTTFPGLNKTQLAWLKRVERDYYLPLLAHRAEEAGRGRATHLLEDPDPIFPSAVPPKRPDNPVHFVGEDGKYAVGTIAAGERKKLPPDALAVVQQLVLWHPQDARLYWQLGELYNATGDVETAAGILDVCTYAMGYSNPTVIEHRRVLKAAADAASAARAADATAKAAEAATAQDEIAADAARQAQADRDYQKRFWWIVSIGVAVVVLLVYYQLREVARRFRRPAREG
jgi:hypothetical protein